jgi:outer membrane protein assembly factor BamB
MRFCGQCGASLPAQVNFCQRCGTPVAASTDDRVAATVPSNAWPQQPTTPATPAVSPRSPEPIAEFATQGGEPRVSRPRSRRLALLIGSGIAVLLVAAWAAWWAFTGSDEVTALPLAVTSEPDLDWSWPAPDVIDSVVADGEKTYALTAGSLIALDETGDELWEVEVDDAEYLTVLEQQPGLLWITGRDTGASLRSTEDGDEVFATEGDIEVVLEDNVIVAEDGEMSSIGLESGNVEWATDAGDDIAVDRDAVHVLGDGQLRRLDRDGEEQWAVDVDLSLGENPYITTAEDFLVVNGEDEAVAFASEDGDELWSVETGDDGGHVGTMFPDQVYIQKNDFSFEDGTEDTRVVIYDRDGRIASMDPDTSFFFAFPVRSEGDLYAFDFGQGILYDQDYQPLGRGHDGSVQPASGGLYELSEGRVRFFHYDEASAVWTLADEFGEDAQLATGDNRLLIADGSDLLSYR